MCKNKKQFKISKKQFCSLSFYSLIVILFSLLSYAPTLFLNRITDNNSNMAFVYIAVFFSGILVSRVSLIFISNLLGEKLKAKIEDQFKHNLMNCFIKQKYNILEKTNTETLAFSSGVNIKNYVEATVNIVENLSFIVTSLLFTFIFIGIQSWILLIFVLLSFVLWISLSSFFTPKIKKKNQEMRANEEEYAIGFSRMFKNVVVTKLLKEEKILTTNMNEIRKNFLKTKYSYSVIRAWAMVMWNLMFGITQLGLIVLTFYLSAKEQGNISGAVSTSSFSSIIYISGMFLGPIFRISQFLHDYNTSSSSIKALKQKIADWEEDREHKKEIKVEKIEFKNVSLKNPQDPNRYLFRNINQVIEKGDFIKIEGPSGSGKTTFLSLIFNENKNYEGHIYFNDQYHDNSKITFVAGLIRQHASIFPLSIRDNISLSQKATDEVIGEVLNKVGLYYLMDRIDQKINLNQNNLSGGELRRIEIARLFLLKPQILILDEAFVGIDQNEKNNIIKIIKEEFKDSIIIYTSHDDYISFNNKTIFINQIKNKRITRNI